MIPTVESSLLSLTSESRRHPLWRCASYSFHSESQTIDLKEYNQFDRFELFLNRYLMEIMKHVPIDIQGKYFDRQSYIQDHRPWQFDFMQMVELDSVIKQI